MDCISSASPNDFLRRNTPLNRIQYKRDARVVCKSGRLLVYFKKIPQKSVQYAKDLWNTLINMQWRWLLLTVAAVNGVAYISCALLFYFDSWLSGDFDNEEGFTTGTYLNLPLMEFSRKTLLHGGHQQYATLLHVGD